MTYPDPGIIWQIFWDFAMIQEYDYSITLGQYKTRYKIIYQTMGQNYKIVSLCISLMDLRNMYIKRYNPHASGIEKTWDYWLLASAQAPKKHYVLNLFFEGNKESVLDMLFWTGSRSLRTFQRKMLLRECLACWETRVNPSAPEDDAGKVFPGSEACLL